MSDLSIPLEGYQRAVSQINVTAARIAQSGVAPSASTSSGGDTVDLSTNMVALLQAQIVAESNLKAFQSIEGIQKSLINAFG